MCRPRGEPPGPGRANMEVFGVMGDDGCVDTTGVLDPIDPQVSQTSSVRMT